MLALAAQRHENHILRIASTAICFRGTTLLATSATKRSAEGRRKATDLPAARCGWPIHALLNCVRAGSSACASETHGPVHGLYLFARRCHLSIA